MPKNIFTPLEVRFWRHVAKSDGCWIWTGRKNKAGYGQVSERGRNGRRLSAHRVSYRLAYGEFDTSLDVCHHCDNPSCVRPDHLFLGTHTDNMQDMIAKGRYRNPSAEARKAQSHCKRGHELTPENTYSTHDGKGRMCAICGRENNRQWREANRERRLAYLRDWNAKHGKEAKRRYRERKKQERAA